MSPKTGRWFSAEIYLVSFCRSHYLHSNKSRVLAHKSSNRTTTTLHSTMSTAIVTKSAAKTLLASRALALSPLRASHVVRVVHSSPPSSSLFRQDLYTPTQIEHDYYSSSFESTLESVLEMSLLGQSSFDDQHETTFQQVVRSSYLHPADYQAETCL